MIKYLLSIVTLSAAMANASYAQELQGCINLAKNKTGSGASQNCAPMILDNDLSFKLIKDLNGKKINYDWYVFIPKDEIKTIKHNMRWQLLSSMVSAIQSLYGENADVFLTTIPESENEKLMLMIGEYPMDKILGHAKYIVPDDLFENNKTKKYPEGHHKRLYKLIIY